MTDRLFARVRAALRQRRHPAAFRIVAPLWNDEQRRRLEEVLAALTSSEPDAPDPSARDEGAGLDEGELAKAVTNLWKAQRRLEDGGSRLVQQTGRYLRNCHDDLAGAGLVVQDHDRLPFHAGLSLEVIEWQDVPGLRVETVVRTVRPSVYFRDHRIQMGQVIVGVPAGGPDHVGSTTGEDLHE